MFTMILVLSLLGLFSSSGAQFLQVGQCNPEISLQPNFNLEQFTGSWYEIRRSGNPAQGGDCSTFELQGNTTLTYNNVAVNNNFLEEQSGTATLENGTAKFTLNLNTATALDFWILDTDYSTYTIAYRCENVGTTQRNVYVWLLGKTTTFPGLTPNYLNNTLVDRLGIQYDDLETIDHSEGACYILPVIAPGQSIILPGQCDPNINVVQNFNASAYEGRWHLVESYPSTFQSGTCNDATYTIQNDGSVLVYNTQVINETLATITGSATLASTDGSAKLNVTFPSATTASDYWVLATDYSSYSLIYSCVNLNSEQRQVSSWKLSRNRSLSTNATNAINQVINDVLVLNDRYYYVVDNTPEGCFYYPEPVPGQNVQFRGQCDMNIPAMPNFDAQRYTGLWHQIEAYPSEFQDGECNNALYTLNGGVVNVYNTQVNNQSLSTINGIAVIASDDGTAKLTVTFPVFGTNLTIDTPYWVIGTDYDSYSLVYTCVNIDADTRRVTSWKLSRTKQMPAAGTTAINNIINTIPVLNQQYYETTDQSVAGCFYFPEPQEGVHVVFPGQCDNSISAVPNFNLTQFQGTWHEIEAYPKYFQPGQCVNHVYTSGTGNTLNLQSFSVVDQFLQVSNSTVSFSSTDNSGRLIITLNSDGNVITIPFWILSTDYTNYALAYSCVNIDADFRAVYSWKLSRTKQLTAASNTAINSTISSVQVLDNVYYEPIGQTDDACFYLPELAPGEPVVLVGQCDPNIAVVSNFNASRYEGPWHLVESYPSTFQTGTCNDHTIQNGDSIVVYNTQVVNETLRTITGSATLATDGSAKLSITVPSSSSPADYWILATDYDSYSLVYSCVNLNSEQRQVWSWKLSRTRSLSTPATNTINQVINGIQVLNNRYYYVVDNTPAGCFYYPEPNGNPVRFRGQCDESIPVVTNFNAVAYMGLWNDIESYPQLFQDGTCATATYSLIPEGVNVFNTQVINQRLDTITGLATVISTDGSAKLNVNFPVAGTNLTIDSPYWVLATDYTNYALVYACSNIDSEYRSVSSWKISRQRTLSAASAQAINNVINSVQVLRQDYYVNRNHTNDGCFYFPEPVAGQPVVFPGQCDNTIQAVPNFNLSSFQGTWHEIEAYPKEDQRGQCINHVYSQGTGNTLNLQSSSVIDQFREITSSTVAFSSTDNSGRLVITLNTNGTVITIPFWVLSTDYTNYALAYSCVDIDSNFRSVYAWKLSRTQQLNAAANTNINTAISTVQVLDNAYFEPIDQSDDACFYLPELAQGEPVVFVGQCDPNISVVQNFNASRYQGRWHLVESYPSTFQSGTCNDHTIQNDGSIVVYNTQVINETLATITGSATLATTDGSAKLNVTFPSAPAGTDYWILDTDYSSYSIVYSCVNLNSQQRQVWSWKLSRTRSLTANAVAAINTVVDSVNVLNNRYYYVVDNTPSGCFYFPEPNGNPVRFRGQCDESIPVVTNFNAVAYMGLWNDIESYPQLFQDGTCATATYSLIPEGVNVFNTQVINQRLDTITGLATVISTDGSAKLNVNFPVAGTNLTIDSPYWVLATDYTNYALVYACSNIDSEYRSVSSWKISRQRTLSAASAQAINNVINSVQVLRQDYYVNRNHTNDGCFYFPEPVAGQPVVFPGQCDNTIQAVPNFNLSSFQGTWHEIEAYPKEDQRGQCINHVYSQGTGNTLNLQSSSVIDQFREITSSTVAFSSTDNSGRLVITLNTNGTVITIPFWVLSTDYTNYALAYSCVDIDSNFRSVYAWKLSRTQQLNAAANTNINTAISTVQVLDNAYFEPIDQSDDACFYLPELAQGEPVVFVGQCDPNISVVQNFNASRYQGRWHLVESYPSTFQSGTCNDHTIQNDGSIVVYNTQVINETLATITGSATLATTDGSAKLNVTFPSAPAGTDYWILDTDYSSYSIVYSCVNLNSQQRQVWSWKLSRTRSLTANAVAAINTVVDSVNVLNNRYYYVVDNTPAGCFYFPEPNGNPVRFRGQCDETINVVNNFDVAAYLGRWYNIENYPQAFQDGTCATADYGLGANGVDVYNTQVVNQQLDTINGTAVVASTDGSAKLLVTFPVAGTNLTVNTPYWVLATDYTGYSLVYSCANIDEEYRSVTSWKLSRQPSLTANANTAINAVINTIDVLRQEYFEETGHTEADCFYYPNNFGGPVILDGQCPGDNEVDVVTNFNVQAFAGTWHEISRFPSELQSNECASSNYVVSNTTNVYTMTQNSVSNEMLITSTGSAVVSNDGRGLIATTLNGNGVVVNVSLYILATDYTDYALAYSCNNVGNNSKQIYSWKFSRSRAGLSQAANNVIDQVVSNNVDLFEGYYENTDQGNDACFYYPEFDTLPDAIELPGPCDDTIRAKANFDTTAYLGRWFETARYPQRNQRGTCNRAEYSSANTGFSVYNYQVLNNQLSSITGTGAVVSNDGSGVLQVTFVTGGVTRVGTLNVLETDYTSFSLLYGCTNLNNGNRIVTSWKLSRERTLSNQASLIIDGIINSTQGLRQEYYNPTSQTDEDCFYVPDLVENNAVLFRGQCENITGMQNFDIQRYLGWWHEIESYPSDNDVGVCISSQFQQSGNQYQVVDTNVFGITATVNTNTLTATSDGRLRRTLSNGQVVDTWVLATDYDTYSLLYSCENVDSEYRRVWSAKHSKSRQLTEAAQNATAPIIENNQVLYPQFYLPVNQSDSDCFHYPEPTGQRIILPGQCDENIPVVQNFDAGAYTGTWYQIEKYPQNFESGTCIGARYTLDETSGVVTVLNWEVINGTLVSLEGNATVSSDDGSAKLIVELPAVGGGIATSPLYVLTTDYVSYSLAYSCENVNQFQRAVAAWKISRTRTMPAAGNTAINAYMAQREELHQPYFIQTEQNDECEEPNSSFLVKSSIIVVLVCGFLHLFF